MATDIKNRRTATHIPLVSLPGEPAIRVSIVTGHYSEWGQIVTTVTRQTLIPAPGTTEPIVDDALGVQLPPVASPTYSAAAVAASHQEVLEQLNDLRRTSRDIENLFRDTSTMVANPAVAAREALSALQADPSAPVDPELVKALAIAVLTAPAAHAVYGVEYMADDWKHWTDEKVQSMPSEDAAQGLVRKDGAECRVVTRTEFQASDWRPTGYIPRSPANPANGSTEG